MTKPSLRTSLPPDELRLKHLAATLEELRERTAFPESWRLAYALDYVADWFGWEAVGRETADDEVKVTYRLSGGPL